MRSMLALAPRLFAGRRASGSGRIDALAVVAFAVSTALLLVVVGGFHLFWLRAQNPPPPLAAAFAASGGQGQDVGMFWVALAALASTLLVVPLMSLSGSAARMGALGCDRRLAALRLVGATPGDVVALTVLETAFQAIVGAALGTTLYLVTLPAWTPLTFQATPIGPWGLLLPAAWIVAIDAGVVVLAAASGAVGLRQVRISPLGVARASGRPRLGWLRVVGLVAVLVVWNVVTASVKTLQEIGTIVTVVVVGIAVFMGAIMLVGPWVLQLFAQGLVRSSSLARRLAGRRLLADPRGAWRSVAGLAFVGFVGGMLLALPDMAVDAQTDPVSLLMMADLRTGTYLTLAISFVIAAAATSLNQVAAVLDRRTILVHLDHAGAPRELLHASRRAEVLMPTVLASVGSAGLAVAFFSPLAAASLVNGGGVPPLLQLALVLAAGIALVWAASEACRPTLAATLAAQR